MNSERLKKPLYKTPDEMLSFERDLWGGGLKHVAGIDEAGRGPLAGPVVAAAVIFPVGAFIPTVDDSKVLTPEQREELYEQIRSKALAVGVGIVEHTVIDEINILNATFRAMHEAVSQLPFQPEYLLIDGNRFAPDLVSGRTAGIPYATIIDGDARCFSIAAASIIAKVTRDRMMLEYDKQFPGYGFSHNMGYATEQHREAIAQLGYCPIHRRTFHLKSQLELEF